MVAPVPYRPPLTGATIVTGLIGDPVAHSLSPAIHNAAFSATGLDWAFVAFPVRAGEVGPALTGAQALGVAGLSVTMPHKAAVFEALSDLTPAARRLESVNVVFRRQGELAGDNTDGAGLINWMAAECQFEAEGKRCVILGAGGAARSVVLALAQAGAVEVTVLNRTAERAEKAALLAGPVGRVGLAGALAEADLVVNATPLGMIGANRDGPSTGSLAATPAVDQEFVGLGIGPGHFRPGQLVVDMVYHPATTALMEMARRQGAQVHNGLGLLVHQAALAFELWTGAKAPLRVMRDAVGGLGLSQSSDSATQGSIHQSSPASGNK
ncbi:MAG: shikimate dehydrogenase [Acidimicrobiales bacterium]